MLAARGSEGPVWRTPNSRSPESQSPFFLLQLRIRQSDVVGLFGCFLGFLSFAFRFRLGLLAFLLPPRRTSLISFRHLSYRLRSPERDPPQATMISSSFAPSLTRRDTAKSTGAHDNPHGGMPPVTSGGGPFGPQSAGAIYQQIHEMAAKRISTLDYLRKA